MTNAGGSKEFQDYPGYVPQGVPYTPRTFPVITTGITELQSPTWVLRELILKKCASLPFFDGFKIKRTRRVPTKPDMVPQLAIYLPEEQMTPDGEHNASVIAFKHAFKLGFSVFVLGNDEGLAEQTLDAAFWAIMNGVWRDEYLMSMVDTRNPHAGGAGNPDGIRIEGILKGTRRHVWGNPALNNEAPLAEMQYDATLQYRWDYPAIVSDTLDKISVQTGFKSDHDGTTAAVQQVEWEYDLTNGSSKGVSNGRNIANDSADAPIPPGGPGSTQGQQGAAGSDRSRKPDANGPRRSGQ